MPRKKSDNMTRFTAWISKEERRRLKEKADRMGTSENLILRFAIRRYFGMEIPEEADSGQSDSEAIDRTGTRTAAANSGVTAEARGN